MTYTTVQGDAFDQIAKNVYGNERRMDALIEANPEHADTVVFSAGTVVLIPDLPEAQRRQESLPPWR